MSKITILPGKDKFNQDENFQKIELIPGRVYSVVGETGAGKSQLIEDIEMLSDGAGITKRQVESDSENIVIAELSQNMNFILDLSVTEFIQTRASILNEEFSDHMENQFLQQVNALCGEQVYPDDKLTRLSGGQSRAVMITDIALKKQAQVVLIDEIENAGIDKVQALKLLICHNKIVVVITHDPLLGLYGNQRIIMKDGGINKVISRSDSETKLINTLYDEHKRNEQLRKMLRSGEEMINA